MGVEKVIEKQERQGKSFRELVRGQGDQESGMSWTQGKKMAHKTGSALLI